MNTIDITLLIHENDLQILQELQGTPKEAAPLMGFKTAGKPT